MCVWYMHIYICKYIYTCIHSETRISIFTFVFLSHFRFIAMPKFTAILSSFTDIHRITFFLIVSVCCSPFSRQRETWFLLFNTCEVNPFRWCLGVATPNLLCSCHIAQEPNSLGCLQVQEKGMTRRRREVKAL